MIKIRFTPGTHALLFGLLVRNAVKTCGDEAVAVCEDGLKRYAMQRGKRMALRTKKHGDELTMLNYMAYSEWKSKSGIIDIKEKDQSPAVTRVYRCPWYETWKRFGFLEEGRLYCRHIDKYLLKGYNNSLKLELKSILTKGNDFCEFVWYGVAMNDTDRSYLTKKKEYLGDSCIMNWEYHCMHLFKTVGEAIENGLEKGGVAIDRAVDEFSKICGSQAVKILRKSQDYDFNVID